MLRQFMSLIASFMFRLLFPISGVKDYTCGYRAYRAEVIKNAFKEYNGGFIDQDGFQATADILLKLRKMDLNFGEVPLLLRYDYKMSTSKMNLIETIRNTFILVFKKIFSLLYS
jgi:dolichol-phosphate mannosyltransferase